jgi:predicted nucleic acid-binding protein
LVTHANPNAASIACKRWPQSHVAQGLRIIVPEIADYELRRELLRANRQRGLLNLDALIQRVEYLPLTTAAMRQAAQFWARARQQGQPTAGDKNIDADVIWAAQAITLGEPNFIVATVQREASGAFRPSGFVAKHCALAVRQTNLGDYYGSPPKLGPADRQFVRL